MKKLYELAKLVRSKNAGPFVLTLDIMFDDHETYEKVLSTGVLSISNIARLYYVDEKVVHMHQLPLANAVKFSFPRKYPSGDFLDDDLYGCQKHRQLVNLDIPVD
jgi:hypothetical protein